MGVSLTLAVLHFWSAGRDRNADLWVASWAGLAVVFEMARWVEIHTEDRQTVIEATRVQVVVAPLLICTLVGFVRRMSGRVLNGAALYFAIANVGFAIAAATTPWFMTNETVWLHDAFGRPYQTGVTTEAIGLMALAIPVALIWMARDIVRASSLDLREKALLLGSLVSYALLGLTSIATAIGSDVVPGLGEYGPLVMAFSLSYLLVMQRRRLELELEGLLVERSHALLASEQRFRNLFDQAPIGVFIMGLDGWIESVNPRLLEIVGSPSGQAVDGNNVLSSETMARAGIADAVRHCLETGEVVTGDHDYTSGWSKTSRLRLILTPARHGREQVGVLGLVEDITERTALEGQLRHSQKLESLGQLAAGLAHEINNPMAYVRTNLGLLRSDWDAMQKELGGADPEVNERSSEMEALIDESMEGVNRTIAIVRDMREFAHSGEEDRVETDVDVVVESCIRVAGTHHRQTTRIEECYGEPPSVLASRGQLQQVVVNLVMNALQAVGDAGRVKVQTSCEANETVIAVDDNGPGVAPENRNRLFDPFFTTKGAGEGTGLGLYISYQIIQAHGGTLTLGESTEGGARFEVRLPVLA